MKKLLIAFLVILTSGSAFYFSTGFHTIWWLMWIAPIPVLIYAYYESFIPVLLVAFIAGLAFGLNIILGYWSTSIPSNAFIPAMFWQSTKWTITILLTRSLMRRNPSLLTIFAYPTIFALLEWLETFTIQGTFNTISYSQLPILPIIQIASLTGYLGITFILGLFSSSIAYAIIFRQDKIKALTGILIGLVVVIFSLGYGYYRIHLFQQEKPLAQIKIGLISVSREPQKIINPKFSNEIFSSYLPLMKNVVSNGAEVILLPEESFSVNTESAPIYQQKLASFAKQNKVKLIIGVRDFKKSGTYNSTWVYDEHGKWIGEYNKRHFVPVVENELTPGIDLLTFDIKKNKSAIAICRDMDYLKPAYDYGALGTQILFVPAWDYVADAYVHATAAWMRGIENGYTLVRAARGGFLSVSIPTGEIIAKAPAMSSQDSMLIAITPIYQNQSFFARHQWWFVIFLWLCLAIIIGYSLLNKKNL